MIAWAHCMDETQATTTLRRPAPDLQFAPSAMPCDRREPASRTYSRFSITLNSCIYYKVIENSSNDPSGSCQLNRSGLIYMATLSPRVAPIGFWGRTPRATKHEQTSKMTARVRGKKFGGRQEIQIAVCTSLSVRLLPSERIIVPSQVNLAEWGSPLSQSTLELAT